MKNEKFEINPTSNDEVDNKKILKKWQSLGLLENTPNERKEFVANSLELLTAYLLHINDDNDDGIYQTMIYPILVRIGREVDFGINDFMLILNEVMNEILLIKYDENSDIDYEELFCNEYSNKKIEELKKIKHPYNNNNRCRTFS